jgi:hypothetical protein
MNIHMFKALQIFIGLSLTLMTSCGQEVYTYQYEYEFQLYNTSGMPLDIDWTIDGIQYKSTVMNGPFEEMFASQSFLTNTPLSVEQLNDIYTCHVYSADSQYVADVNVGDLRYYTFTTNSDNTKPKVAEQYAKYLFELK